MGYYFRVDLVRQARPEQNNKKSPLNKEAHNEKAHSPFGDGLQLRGLKAAQTKNEEGKRKRKRKMKARKLDEGFWVW